MADNTQNSLHDTAQTARKALHLLTERRLPPSPENYAAVYHEISGEPLPETAETSALSPEQKLDSDRELINLVLTLISAASEQTSQLADDLGKQNQDIESSVDALKQTDEKTEILGLLQIISATARSIQSSVEHTGNELISTKNALESMRAELQETRTQLMLDPLTGTRNRFGMDITMSQEIARARRGNSHFSIGLLDLDFFKDINDTYGHAAGDLMLQHFTQLSRSVLRESDILFRYGGEEFLLLLPETELNGAVFMLHRLQQMLAKSPLRFEQEKINATFSGGVTQMLSEDNGASMLQRADRALYAAKTSGRNKIVTDIKPEQA